jgi:GntR family transcriptional regulator, transcriptional repressor for pyruvate dehydrogenase complex
MHTSVERRRVADQIVAALHGEIASGALPPGTKLPTERELAARFGVNPGTIREALRALGAIGLVEVRHGSGAYVALDFDAVLTVSLGTVVQLEDTSVLELVALLRALNLHAAELAVGHATEEDVERVAAAAEATTNAGTVREAADAVGAFLISFAESTHNGLLTALVRFLVQLVVELEISSHKQRSNEFWRKWAAQTSDYRIAIAAALRARDQEKLVAAVAAYHDGVIERLSSVPALRDARLGDAGLAPLMTRLIHGVG